MPCMLNLDVCPLTWVAIGGSAFFLHMRTSSSSMRQSCASLPLDLLYDDAVRGPYGTMFCGCLSRTFVSHGNVVLA